jgi:hypothetical protein
MDILYRFTKGESEALSRRKAEVIRLLSTIAEIRGLPDEVMLAPDDSGFVSTPITKPPQAELPVPPVETEVSAVEGDTGE